MKKSELKKLVKEEIFSILEKEKKSPKSDEKDIDIDMDSELEIGDEDMDLGGDMEGDTSGGSQNVQKELMDALEAAKKLGDKKLVRQIGNALTYFTRSQISNDEQ